MLLLYVIVCSYVNLLFYLKDLGRLLHKRLLHLLEIRSCLVQLPLHRLDQRNEVIRSLHLRFVEPLTVNNAIATAEGGHETGEP